MTSKRKSMSIGSDVHAVSAGGAQPQIYLRSKGFRDAALTSLGPQGHCLPGLLYLRSPCVESTFQNSTAMRFLCQKLSYFPVDMFFNVCYD